MAKNVTALKRGFSYNKVDGNMGVYVDGARVFRFTNYNNASAGSCIYQSVSSSATSGNLYGLRMFIEGTGVSTGALRGIRCEASMGDTASASLLEAGLFTAKVSDGTATVTDIRPVTGHVSIGSGLTVSGTVCCVNAHMQTRSDESIGVHTGVYIKNEAVGGTGLCLAQGAIYITESSLGGSVKGYECLIDASTATMTAQSGNIVHLIKFKDSGGTGRVLYFDSDTNTVVVVTTT